MQEFDNLVCHMARAPAVARRLSPPCKVPSNCSQSLAPRRHQTNVSAFGRGSSSCHECHVQVSRVISMPRMRIAYMSIGIVVDIHASTANRSISFTVSRPVAIQSRPWKVRLTRSRSESVSRFVIVLYYFNITNSYNLHRYSFNPL